MDLNDLREIANRTRYMREAGIALILGSVVLGLFFFIPLKDVSPEPAAVVQATSTPDAFDTVAVDAQAAIVYDLIDKRILYAKNAEAQLPLASLTKLLTVYSALTTLGPDSTITIPEEATRVEAPHSLSAGESFVLSDLARITLTASLNDGATALATTAANKLNTDIGALFATTATSLGLSETYALNGSGLDLSTAISGGYGSAHDIALLAGALVALAPDVALATTEPSASATSYAGKVHTVKNTNPNVVHAPRLLLSKTGFTDLAGGNLALVFDVGLGHPVAVVVLGSTQEARFTDADVLVAATLAHFSGVLSL